MTNPYYNIDGVPTAQSRGASSLLRAEFTSVQTGFNLVATAIAARVSFSLLYTFSTTTTDADPTAGFLRLSSATQNSATTIRMALVGADGITYTSDIDSFDDSTSIVTGQISLVNVADAAKWLRFNVTAVATPSGYKNVSVTNVSSSATNPFVNGDALSVVFTRTGDKGATGNQGSLIRRVTSIVSSATPTPNATTDDMLTITALAAAPTFAAPTGSPVDGQSLVIRIKDNATPRALAWNSIYRASTDLALPTTTVTSKTLYVGFIYNGVDSKWDLVGVLNNM